MDEQLFQIKTKKPVNHEKKNTVVDFQCLFLLRTFRLV